MHGPQFHSIEFSYKSQRTDGHFPVRLPTQAPPPAFAPQPPMAPPPAHQAARQFIPQRTKESTQNTSPSGVEFKAILPLKGRYVMLDPIGRSEHFHVVHAWDTALERNVVIKSLRQTQGINAVRWDLQRERFEREAFYLKMIQSKEVVKFYDFFEDEGAYHLVMEYLDGMTLRAWMERRRPTARQLLFILSQLCDGLKALHKAGILHRDIKPANIIVTRDRRVVLIDLGIAYDLMLGLDPAERGLVRGTPGYLAPEQLIGAPLSPATDIYALGVLMFELATQTPLFNGHSLEETLALQMAHNLPDIHSLLPNPKDRQWRIIAKVTRRCLKKRPTARYQDIDALWKALEAAI